MSTSIDTVSKVSGIAIAIVAVITFIISVMDNREERQDNRINSWRKVAIQKILQDDPENKLGIKDILTRVRGIAWDVPDIDIPKEELSEQRVRELLLEMIASGIVAQNEGDVYNLRFSLKITTDSDEFSKIMIKDLQNRKTFQLDLQKKLNMTPGRFSREDIFENIAKPLGIDSFEYHMLMQMFQGMGTIEIDEDGYVKLKTTQ